ncbi:multicopper oxidase domain-containing protein [Haliea sp. E1-2-M8]|uniref:multicopper oxidase domain-containing protein n=1 Tax=Haliea sp. E1-2-M8 TaxID=3064706 RepID=UPI00271A5C03|nr:multicopper oxidase domain-containing protein [Haliea sp. E1-2-M8]MDO8863636.1 multicopper oxidase domain-containing protein [Haliea sp. E1-2-M8]
MKSLLTNLTLATAICTSPVLWAETIKVDMTVKEVDVVVDNAGTTQAMWTYNGTIPGPLVRVKQGDVVDFTLLNHADNEQSHSMDFHAARVDVLDEFESIKPGQTKQFTFKAEYPGVFIYHCGSDSMAEHIARGMYGVIIVDPAEGYSENFPKADREYVLVQGDLFAPGTSADDMKMGNGWKGALVNGRQFHYDPVHDPNASQTLESRPGERVRIHFVNAMINEAAAFHPIAGIWEQVWDNGNPKNVAWGLQTVEVPPAHGLTLDIVSPADRPTNNALVDHRMKHALNGAISVLMNHAAADPKKGRGDQQLLR